MKRVRCSARSCLLDSLEEEFLADMAEGWFVLELGFGSPGSSPPGRIEVPKTQLYLNWLKIPSLSSRTAYISVAFLFLKTFL